MQLSALRDFLAQSIQEGHIQYALASRLYVWLGNRHHTLDSSDSPLLTQLRNVYTASANLVLFVRILVMLVRGDLSHPLQNLTELLLI